MLYCDTGFDGRDTLDCVASSISSGCECSRAATKPPFPVVSDRDCGAHSIICCDPADFRCHEMDQEYCQDVSVPEYNPPDRVKHCEPSNGEIAPQEADCERD